MNISTLNSLLHSNPDASLTFFLPDGRAIPARYHVTEVGHVARRFIDCSGTRRTTESVQLQLWLGRDEEHRLTAGKLAGILALARDILPSEALEVEVEYEAETLSQYRIASMAVAGGGIEAQLAGKHTDCLAKEACGCEPAESEEAACGCAPGTCCA